MTLIVANWKDGKIITDRFVVDANTDYKHIKSFKRSLEDKVRFTKDNYFAYVFDLKQKEDLIDIILEHIKAYESGRLDKDFKLEIPSSENITVFIFSKRYAYEVNYKTSNKSLAITRTNSWVSNANLSYRSLEQSGLTIDEVFDLLKSTEDFTVSGKSVIMFKDKLKLIPKVKNKGGK